MTSEWRWHEARARGLQSAPRPELYANLVAKEGGDPEMVRLCLEQADSMARWSVKKFPDLLPRAPIDRLYPAPRYPRLAPGTVIDKPCLISDLDGDMWYVHPAMSECRRV